MSSNVLKNLEPYDVFKYFEEITQIPRGSENEKGISDYLVNFAKEHNLEVIQDEALNVIIKKPAASGYENAPTVILQGHMDMVNEKNQNVVHDFDKDPLKLKIEGDMIYASGTTLGADNGIAVAYALAILASKDIAHPPIEVLLTTDEETGMSGARSLNPNDINGRILINMDNEEEGQLLVSCAGGLRTDIVLPLNFEAVKGEKAAYFIKVRGLRGGHSGGEINKGRGNANKIMGRILYDIKSSIDFNLCSLNGGAKDNAIPRESDAVLVLDKNNIDKLEAEINKWNVILKNEYKVSDKDITIELEAYDKSYNKSFSKEETKKAVELLCIIPNGIQTMSMEIKDLVESSSNLGVVVTGGDKVEFRSAVRSSVKTLKEDIVVKSRIAAESLGAQIYTRADYPAWEYNADSKIRGIFERVYKEIYGKDVQIVAIHAGVECGLFKEKFGDIDMISFGPNLYDVHTPNEHMSISSVQRTFEYLVKVLKEIK